MLYHLWRKEREKRNNYIITEQWWPNWWIRKRVQLFERSGCPRYVFVNSTGTNKTTVLEELENQKDANQKCFGSTSQSYRLALPRIIHSSKQGKTRTRQGGNPFRRLIQANSVYIFWYQEAVKFATTMLKLLFWRWWLVLLMVRS